MGSSRMYGCNVCGEGGEYESLTLDCPLFLGARIVLDAWELVLHSVDSVAPVGVLHATHFHLVSKNGESGADMVADVIDVPQGAHSPAAHAASCTERPACCLPGLLLRHLKPRACTTFGAERHLDGRVVLRTPLDVK